MDKKHITIMINGTVNDMFGEYKYFIEEVFPELKEFCENHGIELEYKHIGYSISFEDFMKNRTIFNYLNFIDEDRTFFICFKGQKLGWVPSQDDVDELTLEVYPELVNYVCPSTITDLCIMHALKPFAMSST